MKKILLHVCCAPCAAYVFEELIKQGFEITAFFYNPNIYPQKEYDLRKNEVEKYCKKKKIDFIEIKEDYGEWRKKVLVDSTGSFTLFEMTSVKEGEQRCFECYKIRLEKTARFAKENNQEYFESTLAISPHKNYNKIKEMGDALAQKYGVKFLGKNWKKKDGYKKSCEISRKNNFYRQIYCGCEFSINE